MINFLFYRSGVVLPEPEHYLEPEPSIFWSRSIFGAGAFFGDGAEMLDQFRLWFRQIQAKEFPDISNSFWFLSFILSFQYFEFLNLLIIVHIHFKMLLVHCSRSRTLLLLLKKLKPDLKHSCKPKPELKHSGKPLNFKS